MTDYRIFLSPPSVGQIEEDQLIQTLRRGWIASVGPELEQFEQLLEDRFADKKVLALNSGTAALHLAIKLAGIEPNDHVIVGTFTFIAAGNCVLYEGGIPVFMDSEDQTWNLDPDLLRDYLKKAKKLPKVVLATHIFGRPAQIKAIKEVCNEYDIKLIEDGAESLGSRCEGTDLGSFGNYGVLSFSGNKIITTSVGGALICDKDDYDRAKYLANQAKESAPFYQHSERGYNYLMSNLLAGLGIAQLKKLPAILDKKREIWDNYYRLLDHANAFEFKLPGNNLDSNFWLSTLLLKNEISKKVTPNRLIESLAKQGIEARRFWKPLHLQPLYQKNSYIGGNIAEDLFDRGICLPSGVGLEFNQQEEIAEVITSTINSL